MMCENSTAPGAPRVGLWPFSSRSTLAPRRVTMALTSTASGSAATTPCQSDIGPARGEMEPR